MKNYLLLLLIIMEPACSKQAPVMQEPRSNIDNHSIIKIFDSDKSPSISSTLVAVQLLKNDLSGAPQATQTLLNCAQNPLYTLDVKTICILGIGLLRVGTVSSVERNTLATSLNKIFLSQDAQMKNAVLSVFCKQPILLEKIGTSSDIANWFTDPNIPTRIRAYLFYQIWKTNNPNISSWLKNYTDIFSEIIKSAQSYREEIQFSFEFLYKVNTSIFSESLRQFCPLQTHPALYPRCWRTMAIVLSAGITKEQLLPYVKNINGNWFSTFSGTEWNTFKENYPEYASILSKE